MSRLVTQAKKMDINFIENLPDQLSQFALIVDACFGFSFRPPLREPFGDILESVAASKVPIASIDVPSGMFTFAYPLYT